MKKIFITVSVIAVSSILFFTCYKRDETAVVVDFSTMKFDLDLKYGRPGNELLFLEYDNMKDMSSKLNNPVNLMISEFREIIVDTPSISNVAITINFSKNKAVITSYYFFNEKNTELSYGFVWDKGTKTYVRVEEEGGDGDAAAYPAGYTELAVCDNSNNPQACVTAAVAAYLSANLPGPYTCATVQVSVGLSKTRVCGKKC